MPSFAEIGREIVERLLAADPERKKQSSLPARWPFRSAMKLPLRSSPTVATESIVQPARAMKI